MCYLFMYILYGLYHKQEIGYGIGIYILKELKEK